MPKLTTSLLSNNAKLNDPVFIGVFVDTEGAVCAGVDVILSLPGLTFIDYHPTNLLPVKVYNSYDNGVFTFSQLTNVESPNLAVKGLLAVLECKASSQGSKNINFNFTLGSTTDSNIAGSNGQDLLTSVVNSVLNVDSIAAPETELLSAPWKLVGNNGASEKYQPIPTNSLNGKTELVITYDLHGFTFGGGNASAIIFDQPGWKYISLSNYGQNGLNGLQTVVVPLSAFVGLDTTKPVGTLHTRFWRNGAWTVDINSIKIR